jgi:hypothetical protein
MRAATGARKAMSNDTSGSSGAMAWFVGRLGEKWTKTMQVAYC